MAGGGGSSKDAGATFNRAGGFDQAPVALAVDEYERLWVGGRLSAYTDQPVQNLARFEGSLGQIDTSFDLGSGPNNSVNAILPLANGSGAAWIAGAFTEVDGAPRRGLALIQNVGALESFFEPGSGFLGVVNALALADDDSGDVWAGGTFSAYDGTPLGSIVRIRGDTGAIALGFATGGGFALASAPNFQTVRALALVDDGSGDLLVGGRFDSYDGASAPYLARLRDDGSLVTAFGAAGSPDGTVEALLTVGDGSGDVFVGGSFGSVANILRLGNDGSLQIQYPVLVGAGFSLCRDGLAANRFYVAGAFSQVGSHLTKNIARLDVDGGAPDGSFTIFDAPGVGPNGAISAAIATPDGAILVNGNYTQWDGATARNLVKVDAAGQDYSNAGFVDGVVYDYAIAQDGSGRVWAAGNFSVYFDSFSPAPRVGLLRPVAVNFYELDPLFAPGSGFGGGVPRALAIRPQTAQVYVGGDFAEFDGQPVPRIARLNTDGSLDRSFEPGTGFDGAVQKLAVAADGTGDIYAFGDFAEYDGTPVSNFVRIKATGALDPTFANSKGFNGTVRRIAPLGGGSREVYVAGLFTSYGGVTTGSVVRLSAGGSVD